MSNIIELSSEQLKKAANIKEQIERLQEELASVLGTNGNQSGKPATKVTDERRAKQSSAMKSRWAARKSKNSPTPSGPATTKAKRTMSPEARAKIAAAARKRWAARKKTAGNT